MTADDHVTECDECGNALAKNDDALFRDGDDKMWLCDCCIEDRIAEQRALDALGDAADEMGEDTGYLVALVAEALEADEHFESDYERGLWAVAQWCQELNVLPDLDDYTTGECVSPGEQAGKHPRTGERYE